MTHGLGPGKPGPRAAKPITPPYVENNYRIEVKITFMLIAYLVLLCEFFLRIFDFSLLYTSGRYLRTSALNRSNDPRPNFLTCSLRQRMFLPVLFLEIIFVSDTNNSACNWTFAKLPQITKWLFVVLPFFA